MYLRLFQLLGTLALFGVLLSQVVIPLWHRKPTWPMFSKKRSAIEDEFINTNEQIELKALQERNNQLKDKLHD